MLGLSISSLEIYRKPVFLAFLTGITQHWRSEQSQSLGCFMRCFRTATVFLFLFSVLAPASSQELLIQYTFDEGSGPALDAGNGVAANGTFGSTATRTDDTPGGASPFALDLRATGTESFVNGGDAAKVDTLESFTLTTWLKLEGLNADQGGSGNVRLIAKQAGGDFPGISWNLSGPTDGERGPDNFRTGLFIGGESGFGFEYSSENVSADNWAFLAVTYDGTEEFENAAFYFGDEESETILLGDEFFLDIPAGPVASTAGDADFGIGFTDGAPGTDFSADGYQDDVRVYSGVLSLEQLEAVRLENLVSSLSCDPSSMGDIDGDGTVAFADFLTLSSNFGRSDDVTVADGDIDCSGDVAFADFLILSQNFGLTIGGAQAVPEPATFSLLGLALVVGLQLRRRR